MKRVTLILAAILVCGLTFGQQDKWVDTLDFSEITGSDTVIWKADPASGFYEYGGAWSIDIKYDTLDADDATVSIGGGNHADTTWNQLDDSNLPFTLNVTSNAADVNGTSKTSVAFYGYYWPFMTVGIKVDPGSVTDSYLIIRWIQNY
jgi:hypothetical protein